MWRMEWVRNDVLGSSLDSNCTTISLLFDQSLKLKGFLLLQLVFQPNVVVQLWISFLVKKKAIDS